MMILIVLFPLGVLEYLFWLETLKPKKVKMDRVRLPGWRHAVQCLDLQWAACLDALNHVLTTWGPKKRVKEALLDRGWVPKWVSVNKPAPDDFYSGLPVCKVPCPVPTIIPISPLSQRIGHLHQSEYLRGTLHPLSPISTTLSQHVLYYCLFTAKKAKVQNRNLERRDSSQGRVWFWSSVSFHQSTPPLVPCPQLMLYKCP